MGRPESLIGSRIIGFYRHSQSEFGHVDVTDLIDFKITGLDMSFQRFYSSLPAVYADNVEDKLPFV